MKPEELTQWRMDNGYTQGELADVLGIALMSVSRWETGMRKIPPFLHLALKALPKKGGDRKQAGPRKRKRKGANNGKKRNL